MCGKLPHRHAVETAEQQSLMQLKVCPTQLLQGLHRLVQFSTSTSAQAAVTTHIVSLIKESCTPVSYKFVTAFLPGSFPRKVTKATEEAETRETIACKALPPSLKLKYQHQE